MVLLNTYMKNLFAALLTMMSMGVLAQTAPECGETEFVLRELMKEYKERPIWIGRTDKGLNYGIFANIQGKSWTMIQYNEKVSCIILVGSESAVFPEPKSTRIRTATPD
jgi:hypothetical protein